MSDITKKQFYDFAVMMKKDSKLLFENGSFHNSVYFGAFVLEAYIKILLIHKGQNYFGHINDKDNKFLKKLDLIKTLYPEYFENSILNQNNIKYPIKLLSDEYDINFRYKVDKWTDELLCQNIQNEVQNTYEELIRYRREGILNDSN